MANSNPGPNRNQNLTPQQRKIAAQRAARRRKKRQRRIAILAAGALAVILIIVGLCIFAFRHFYLIPKQKAEQESISISLSIQKQAELSADREKIQNMQVSGDITQETLDELKTSALAGFSTAPDGALEWNDNEQSGQAKYFLDHLDQYNEGILAFYLNNPERYEFVKAYPDRASYQNPPAQLTGDLKEVPELYQWSLDWGYLPYGDSTMYYAGCAPTSLSMVLSYLRQDPTLTPAAIKDFSESSGYYVSGAGTSHELLDVVGPVYGVNVERISVDQETISQALKEGKKLIFNMVPGKFTQVGHFMVAADEADGKLEIHDPNNISRTKQLWSYEDVLPETAIVWAYSK